MCGSGTLTQRAARGLQRPEGQGSAGTGQEGGDHRADEAGPLLHPHLHPYSSREERSTMTF